MKPDLIVEELGAGVFGLARTPPGHWVYQEVKRMCTALGAMGCDIVTGGLGARFLYGKLAARKL